MWTWARTLRWTATGAFLFAITPVAQEFLIELAREHGFYKDPSERVRGIMSAIAQNWYYHLGLVFLAGLLVGAWLDWLARKIDLRNAGRTETATETDAQEPGGDQHLKRIVILEGLVKELRAKCTDLEQSGEIIFRRFFHVGEEYDPVAVQKHLDAYHEASDIINRAYPKLRYNFLRAKMPKGLAAHREDELHPYTNLHEYRDWSFRFGVAIQAIDDAIARMEEEIEHLRKRL